MPKYGEGPSGVTPPVGEVVACAHDGGCVVCDERTRYKVAPPAPDELHVCSPECRIEVSTMLEMRRREQTP